MIHGFDLSSPLVCEGIVGDGCGGGRIFYVQDEKLQTFDPVTKKSMILLENVKNAQKISKSACIITIECSDQIIKFDLSLL
ncbi:thiamine biosynthesis protein ThiF [Sulfurimonas sediminis]|uniref:Thiamine biosynthesis protein ThiF n=1 Tax=Sulfurimonas sediminis TaxID=2590020 RepID=A0A7M1B0G9_9BACT|nr:thiamine biosynthesis protein ThiF [Sulfurimonas sediminis]QOP43046.1 thiamine biosynthesis protein ThiF [Sulfurimonas sediminis]